MRKGYRLRGRIELLSAAAALTVGSAGSIAQTTVLLQDNFTGGSTIDSGNAPTSNSTSYDIATNSQATAPYTIGGGSLAFNMAATSNGIVEAQALFTTTPVNVEAATDQELDCQITFTDVAGIDTTTNVSNFFSFGLYDSGKQAPDTNLSGSVGLAGTMNSSNSNDANNGAANWDGVWIQTTAPGGSTAIVARSVSSGITGTGSLMVQGTASVFQLRSNSGASTLGSLSVNSGSTMDLTNNALLINYGKDPISTIQSYLASGYNNGAWNGLLMNSSTVASLNATQSALIYSVGYADGNDGLGIVPSGEIEILPTLAGDAKLQGNVNFGDFQLLAANFGSSAGWDGDNFTYGSVVNFGDFQLLAQNFGDTSAALSGNELASLNNFAAQFGDEFIPNPDGVGFELVSVPEPASAAILAGAGAVLLSRRRLSSRLQRRK